jgi:peptidyl-Lys metalloendopeptidase
MRHQEVLMIRSSVWTIRNRAWLTVAVLAAGSLALHGCADAPDQGGNPVDETGPSDPSDPPVAITPEAQPEDLTVALAGPTSTFGATDAIQISVTLTNIADHPVRVLRRNTPLDGIKEDLFNVSLDGAAIEYLGRHYKWAEPQPQDFVTIDAGKSVSSTVDISTAYDFGKTGSYAINYGAAMASHLAASTVTVLVEGRPFIVPSSGASTLTASLTTTGCSSTRISQLTTAYANARSMAGAALTYLSSTTPSGTPRYVTWFGTFSTTRWNTAKAHFTSISQKLVNEVANCTCTDSAYAYVFPSQPYTIYLCNAFWPAPATGTDSKAGTLIHEMSHFNVVASTDDNAYGQTACKRLARSSATRALDNADSHEYFAENTPFQP